MADQKDTAPVFLKCTFQRILCIYIKMIGRLDVFHKDYEGLLLAEVEFLSEEAANSYTPPAWFGRDVTFSSDYHNSTLSKGRK